MWAFYWDFSCCYPIDVFKKECKNAVLKLNRVILIDKKKVCSKFRLSVSIKRISLLKLELFLSLFG